MRVVLYAEGAGEVGGGTLPPAPGRTLWEDIWGPAHFLITGALAFARHIPAKAIQFEQGLRIRGRLPKGSDLLSKKKLRQLLTWADPARRPELAIVLVDADGDSSRRDQLLALTEDLPVPKVIAVAVQEFESWLIADPDALARVVGPSAHLDRPPESLTRGEAKKLLADWCARTEEQRSGEEIRLSLAQVEPVRLKDRSASYARLIDDLRRL